MLEDKAIDITFTLPMNKIRLSAIRTGFFSVPWDIDLQDKWSGGRMPGERFGIPKHARAKETCLVTFHGGDPEIAMAQTGCRIPLSGEASRHE